MRLRSNIKHLWPLGARTLWQQTASWWIKPLIVLELISSLADQRKPQINWAFASVCFSVCVSMSGPSWSPPATSDEAVEAFRSIPCWFIAVGTSIVHTATDLGQTLRQIYAHHFFSMELTSMPAGLSPWESVCLSTLRLFNLIYY